MSKGVTHPPWLTTSKGAHHYNFSDSTRHPTYSRIHQCPDTSVPPEHTQCKSLAQYCTAATRDCTLTYNTKHMPDHAPCSIPPTHKTPAIPMNSQPGYIG